MDNLTQNQKLEILASLYATCKSGGGSPTFHLFNQLSQTWDLDFENSDLEKMVQAKLEIVISEFASSMA